MAGVRASDLVAVTGWFLAVLLVLTVAVAVADHRARRQR